MSTNEPFSDPVHAAIGEVLVAFEKTRFRLEAGLIQPRVARECPFYVRHFGRIQYNRAEPVLSESIRSQAQPIVDALNDGSIDTSEAEKRLNRIFY